jgi:hypothetical protein
MAGKRDHRLDRQKKRATLQRHTREWVTERRLSCLELEELEAAQGVPCRRCSTLWVVLVAIRLGGRNWPLDMRTLHLPYCR